MTLFRSHEFNKRGKSKELKPAIEVIPVEVPQIIDQATLDTVQAHLKARSPKVAHPQVVGGPTLLTRSEEHTSELQSLMRISYAVFCLKKKNKHMTKRNTC